MAYDNSVSLLRNPTKPDSTNIRVAEGLGTTVLSKSDSFKQLFNLTAARTVQLPSTSVIGGDFFRLENRTAFTLSVSASNGSLLTIANSCNQRAVVNIGWLMLTALQDNPTTPAHWYVLECVDTGSYTPVITASTNVTVNSSAVPHWYQRINNTVRVDGLFNNTVNPGAGGATFTFFVPIFRETNFIQGKVSGSGIDTGTVTPQTVWAAIGSGSIDRISLSTTNSGDPSNQDVNVTFSYRLD